MTDAADAILAGISARTQTWRTGLEARLAGMREQGDAGAAGLSALGQIPNMIREKQGLDEETQINHAFAGSMLDSGDPLSATDAALSVPARTPRGAALQARLALQRGTLQQDQLRIQSDQDMLNRSRSEDAAVADAAAPSPGMADFSAPTPYGQSAPPPSGIPGTAAPAQPGSAPRFPGMWDGASAPASAPPTLSLPLGAPQYPTQDEFMQRFLADPRAGAATKLPLVIHSLPLKYRQETIDQRDRYDAAANETRRVIAQNANDLERSKMNEQTKQFYDALFSREGMHEEDLASKDADRTQKQTEFDTEEKRKAAADAAHAGVNSAMQDYYSARTQAVGPKEQLRGMNESATRLQAKLGLLTKARAAKNARGEDTTQDDAAIDMGEKALDAMGQEIHDLGAKLGAIKPTRASGTTQGPTPEQIQAAAARGYRPDGNGGWIPVEAGGK